MPQTQRNFTINSSDAVGTTKVVSHGQSLAPQIVIATGVNTTTGASQVSYQKAFGVACKGHGDTSITQFCTAAHSDNALSLTDADLAARSDAILAEVLADPIGTSGRIELTAIGTSSLTFTIREQFNSSMNVQLSIIGGNDIDFVELGSFKGPSQPGLFSFKNARKFKPDFILFFGHHLSQTPPFTGDDSTTHIGAATGPSNQWTWAGGCNNGGAGGSTGSGRNASYMNGTACLSVMQTDVRNLHSLAKLQSMDADGFTLFYSQINLLVDQTSGRRFFALMVKGPLFSVGSFTSFTDTSPHTVSTPFSPIAATPAALMFVSANKPQSAEGLIDAGEQLSIGLHDVVNGGQRCHYVGQRGIVWSPTTVTWVDRENSTSCYLYEDSNSGPVFREGAASVTGAASNQITWTHSDGDPVSSFIGYIAYAPYPTPGGVSTITKTVKPNGGGDYTNLNTAIQTELTANKNLLRLNSILKFDCYAGIDHDKVTVPGQFNSLGQGYMTSATNYIHIKAIDGHAGRMVTDGSKYLLDVNINSSGRGSFFKAEFVKMEQIQMRVTRNDGGEGGGGYCVGETDMVAPTHWEFINCIGQAVMENGSSFDLFVPPGKDFDETGVKCSYINCIAFDVIHLDKTARGFFSGNAPNGQKIIQYNCAAINCNTGFLDHAQVIQKNCVALGCDNGWNSGTGTGAGPGPFSSNNISTNGPTAINNVKIPFTNASGNLDARGPNSVNGMPIYLTDGQTGDYKPMPLIDRVCIGKGLNLSADTEYAFNFGVEDTTTARFSPWAIGPWNTQEVAGETNLSQAFKWAWTGGVSSTAVRIVSKWARKDTIRLEITTDPSFVTSVVTSDWATLSDGVCRMTLNSLAPSTKYYYRLRSLNFAAFNAPLSRVYSFSTFPIPGTPSNFTVAMGSCSVTGSNSHLYDRGYKPYNPLLYIMMGDLNYMNVDGCNVLVNRWAYEAQLTMPKRVSLLETVPVDYVWDDHDFADSNSDQFDKAKAASQLNYRRMFPNYQSLPGDVTVDRYQCDPDCTDPEIVKSGDSTTPFTWVPTARDRTNALAWRQKVALSDTVSVRLTGSATGMSWIGGEIIHQNPPNETWSTMHDKYGILIQDTVSKVRIQNPFIFNSGDGISFDDDGQVNQEIHGAWIKYNRDDGIENDFYANLIIHDCFIDGAFVGIGSREYVTLTDKSSNIMYISDCIIRMQGKDESFSGTVPNHFGFWKLHDNCPRIVVENTVFRADSHMSPSVGAGGVYMIPPANKTIHFKNCVMCWLGEGSFPETLPPGMELLTGSTALDYYNAVVTQWKADHPLQLADTTAPIVSVFLPVESAVVSGTVDIWVTAEDDRAVASVQFKVDGSNIGTLQTAPTDYKPADNKNWDLMTKYKVSWDSTSVSNGAHTITAEAKDAVPNTRLSAVRNITVSN